jgi:hypothetical protein
MFRQGLLPVQVVSDYLRIARAIHFPVNGRE